MTDTQILTLVIGITFPVLGVIGAITASIHANKRIDEAISASGKRVDEAINSFGTRMDAFDKSINHRMDAFEKRIIERVDNGFEHMGLLLKLHEAEHHKH